jgi:hypothetical protein
MRLVPAAGPLFEGTKQMRDGSNRDLSVGIGGCVSPQPNLATGRDEPPFGAKDGRTAQGSGPTICTREAGTDNSSPLHFPGSANRAVTRPSNDFFGSMMPFNGSAPHALASDSAAPDQPSPGLKTIFCAKSVFRLDFPPAS